MWARRARWGSRAPGNAFSRLAAPLARRRNERARQVRRWLPDAARRAGPRRAAQAVALTRTRRTVARPARTGSLSTRVGARNARLAVRSPACAQRPSACRQLTAVLPYIRQYGVISARRCRPGQRRGCSRVRQAYPRRRDGGGSQTRTGSPAGGDRRHGRPEQR